MAILLGYDIGSLLVKAMLLDTKTGKTIALVTMPKRDIEIVTKKPSWVERHSQAWWGNVIATTQQKLKPWTNFAVEDVTVIGISYQTHGFIAIDEGRRVIRNVMLFCRNNANKVEYKGTHNNSKRISLIRKKRKCYWWFNFVLFMVIVITMISICTAIILSYSNPQSPYQKGLQGMLFETCNTTWKMGSAVIIGLLGYRIYRRR